jgi:antitoxin component of MazEF toxin-antitoxin module
MKAMKESLKAAAAIRQKLDSCAHSDSTKLMAEDRGHVDVSSTDQELNLEDLIAGVTEENRHPEIDFGAPVGKEKW